MLVLASLALFVLHPEMVPKCNSKAVQVKIDGNSNNFSLETVQIMRHREWTSEDKTIGLMITFGTFLVTIMLVAGAIKGRPGYLMPFFCLQVFDFSLSCLTIVGYFSYMPDLKGWIEAQDCFPYKEYLLKMDGDWLMLLAVMFFMLILSMKAYFLGIVWACYKYLTGYQRVSNGVRRYTDGETDDSEMLLPPKYEDAIRMANEEPAPPPYTSS